MPFLISILVVLSASFYFYTYEWKPQKGTRTIRAAEFINPTPSKAAPHTTETSPSPPAPSPQTPPTAKEVTGKELHALAKNSGLLSVAKNAANRRQRSFVVEGRADHAIAVAQALLDRPGSTLVKSWLRRFITIFERARYNPDTDIRADVVRLERELNYLMRSEKYL